MFRAVIISNFEKIFSRYITHCNLRVTRRLAQACLGVVIGPVVSAFAFVKGVHESHLESCLLRTGNRLYVRLNTDATIENE